MWDYFYQPARSRSEATAPESEPLTGGATINVFKVDDVVCYSKERGRQSKVPSPVPWNQELLHLLYAIQDKTSYWQTAEVKVRSELRVGEQIYRGHPEYRGQAWQDWILVDWTGEGKPEPCRVWCFLEVTGLPYTTRKKLTKHKDILNHGGILLVNGAYAVVETARWARANQQPNSKLIRKLTLEMASNVPGSGTTRRRFHLVPINKITRPLFVVPDIGSQNRRDFLAIKSRTEWVDVAKAWLEKPLPEEYKKDLAALGAQQGLHNR